LQRAARAKMEELEQSARERSRENAYYERYFWLWSPVTYNTKTKGQTRKENTWTVTRSNEETPSLKL